MSAIIYHLVPMDKLPNRIRELRKRAGISQQALADKVNVSKPTISELETGKMQLTLDYMRRIAHAFGIHAADVLNEEDHSLLLRDDEKVLIQMYRAADPIQREMINRIAEPRGVPAERSGSPSKPENEGPSRSISLNQAA